MSNLDIKKYIGILDATHNRAPIYGDWATSAPYEAEDGVYIDVYCYAYEWKLVDTMRIDNED